MGEPVSVVHKPPQPYWTGLLGGEQPVLELPFDRPRPARQSHRGAQLGFELPRELVEAVRALAQREGASSFMLLLASFQALLYRYSGQADIRVGVPIANRNRVETERLIGFFVADSAGALFALRVMGMLG